MPAGRLMFTKNAAGELVPVGESDPMPTVAGASGGTAVDNDDVAVDGTVGGVELLAANANRISALIQNTGAEPMRVTTDGSPPTATHGKKIPAGGSLQMLQPAVSRAQVLAIQEGASATTANASEVSS